MKKKTKNRFNKQVLYYNDFPIKLFSNSLTWLSRLMKVSNTEAMFLQKVLRKIARVYETRGKTSCVEYSKHLRSSLLRFLSNNEGGVQNYLPKIFLPVKEVLSSRSNYPFLRLLLTVTYSTRFIRNKGIPSFSSIEKWPGFTGSPSLVREDIKGFLKEAFGVNPKHLGKPNKSLRFKGFHMTSKSGPTGLHALWSSFWDIYHLPTHLQLDLITVAGDRLGDLMNRFLSLSIKIRHFFEFYTPFKGKDFRKMTIINDKEQKN
jgi:hypothetical protein